MSVSITKIAFVSIVGAAVIAVIIAIKNGLNIVPGRDDKNDKGGPWWF